MIKTALEFYKDLVQKFPFEPTDSQDLLFIKLSDFVFEKNNDSLFFLYYHTPLLKINHHCSFQKKNRII